MSYLTLLTPRVAWSQPDHVRDRPVLGAIMGQRGTLIVDTGASAAHAREFLAALAELRAGSTDLAAPQFAALTHWHWDHVFGTEAMSLPTIGHVETRRRVLEMARLDWRDAALDARVAAGQEVAFIADHVKVELTNAERARLTITPPDITFTDQVEVDLGGIMARILHVGGDHAPDSTVIYTQEERVAFLGDCYFEGFIGTERFYTQRLLPLLDTLAALPVDFYMLGHDAQPLPREEFLKEADMLRRIGELVEKFGADQGAIMAALPAALGEQVNEDHQHYVNAFLRGLQPDILT